MAMASLDVCCRRRGRRRSRRNNHRRNPQKSHLKKNRTKNQPASFRDFVLFPLSILILLLPSAEKPMKSRKPPTPQTKTAHGNSGSNPLIPISIPTNIPPFPMTLLHQRYHHPRTKIDRIPRLHTHKRPESENCAAVEDSCEEVEDEKEVGEGSGGEGLS